MTKDAFLDLRINPLFKTDIVNVCWDTLTLDELLNLFRRESALAAGDLYTRELPFINQLIPICFQKGENEFLGATAG